MHIEGGEGETNTAWPRLGAALLPTFVLHLRLKEYLMTISQQSTRHCDQIASGWPALVELSFVRGLPPHMWGFSMSSGSYVLQIIVTKLHSSL